MTDKFKRTYDEHERTVRHAMCIFMALESLFLLFLLYVSMNWDHDYWRDMDLLYYHDIQLSEWLSSLFIFGVVPPVCTLLSMRFKTFYYIIEVLHLLLAILMLLASFGSLIIVSLLLSIRFIIYLKLLYRY